MEGTGLCNGSTCGGLGNGIGIGYIGYKVDTGGFEMSKEQTAFLETKDAAVAYAEEMEASGWDARVVQLGDKWAVRSKLFEEKR